jgi:sec-independent protein translocase protein TatB
MFDIGGWEFLLIVALGIIIIGPKELPHVLRNIMVWVRKARGLAREFQSGIDDIVQEAEFEQIRQDVMSGSDPSGALSDLKHELDQTLDPDGDVEQAFSIEDKTDWFSDHDEQDELELDDVEADQDGQSENSIGLPEPTEADAPSDDDKTGA